MKRFAPTRGTRWQEPQFQVPPTCLRCGYEISCQYWLGDLKLFFLPSVIWRHHRLLCCETSRPGFYLWLIAMQWMKMCWPRGRRCCPANDYLPVVPHPGVPRQWLLSFALSSFVIFFSPFTIVSGSGAFSAMTCDLLRLQSFLLNLLIRLSPSSLGGRSSTRAPDEALRSNSGSRIDLSVRKVKSHRFIYPRMIDFTSKHQQDPQHHRHLTSQVLRVQLPDK